MDVSYPQYDSNDGRGRGRGRGRGVRGRGGYEGGYGSERTTRLWSITREEHAAAKLDGSNKSLFVTGLDGGITKETLQEVYGQFAEVESVKIVPDNSRPNTCLAYVNFTSHEGADFARRQLDQQILDGRLMRVRFQAFREDKKEPCTFGQNCEKLDDAIHMKRFAHDETVVNNDNKVKPQCSFGKKCMKLDDAFHMKRFAHDEKDIEHGAIKALQADLVPEPSQCRFGTSCPRLTDKHHTQRYSHGGKLVSAENSTRKLTCKFGIQCKKMTDLDHMQIFIHGGKIFVESGSPIKVTNATHASTETLMNTVARPDNLKRKPFIGDIDERGDLKRARPARHNAFLVAHKFLVYKWPQTPHFTGGYGFDVISSLTSHTISCIVSDSPAAYVNLQQNDYVVEVNGSNVESASEREVVDLICQHPDKVSLLVLDGLTHSDLSSRGLTAEQAMADFTLELHECPVAPPTVGSSTSAICPIELPGCPFDGNCELQKDADHLAKYKHNNAFNHSQISHAVHMQSNSESKTKMSSTSQTSSLSATHCIMCHWPEKPGFGFQLRSDTGRNFRGHFIGKVDAHSPAEYCKMKVEDRILEVNGVNVEVASHEEVKNFITTYQKYLSLLVVDTEADKYLSGTLVTSGHDSVVKIQCPERSIGDPVACEESIHCSRLSDPNHSMIYSHKQPETDTSKMKQTGTVRQCAMYKWPDYEGYGFDLGVTDQGPIIASLESNSPAELSKLKLADRIIEINDINVEAYIQTYHQDALADIIGIKGNTVSMLVVDSDSDEYFKSQNEAISSKMAGVQKHECPRRGSGEMLRCQDGEKCQQIYNVAHVLIFYHEKERTGPIVSSGVSKYPDENNGRSMQELSSQSRELPSQSRNLLSQSRELPSHSRELPSQSRELPSQSRELPSQSRESPSQLKETIIKTITGLTLALFGKTGMCKQLNDMVEAASFSHHQLSALLAVLVDMSSSKMSIAEMMQVLYTSVEKILSEPAGVPSQIGSGPGPVGGMQPGTATAGPQYGQQPPQHYSSASHGGITLMESMPTYPSATPQSLQHVQQEVTGAMQKTQWHCKICNISCNSPDTWKAHINGAKHLKATNTTKHFTKEQIPASMSAVPPTSHASGSEINELCVLVLTGFPRPNPRGESLFSKPENFCKKKLEEMLPGAQISIPHGQFTSNALLTKKGRKYTFQLNVDSNQLQAFARFTTPEQAQMALKAVNGLEVKGRTIHARFASIGELEVIVENSNDGFAKTRHDLIRLQNDRSMDPCRLFIRQYVPNAQNDMELKQILSDAVDIRIQDLGRKQTTVAFVDAFDPMHALNMGERLLGKMFSSNMIHIAFAQDKTSVPVGRKMAGQLFK